MSHDERPTVQDNPKTVADLYAELERERQRNAQLQEKVDELLTFARDVSHDLKAPLAGICGYAQLLEHLDLGPGRPAEYDEFVSEINRSTTRMRELIDDVLDYSTVRDTRLHIRPVDVNTLADDIIMDATASSLRRPPPVITRDDLPPVQGDHAMVRRLLENILGNSINFSRLGQAALRGESVPASPLEAAAASAHRPKRAAEGASSSGQP